MNYLYPEYFARFYDLIYHKVRDGVDNKFFLELIKKTKGKVLEVGVGTGRFFIDALNNGADIYGIDISPAMINVLISKLEPEYHQRVRLQNIVDFSFDFKFDLIIAPFRVFSHLLNKTDQLRALNNIYSHLNMSGKFIFDVFVPDLKQLIDGMKNIKDFDEEYESGKRLKRIISTKPDLINQIIHITMQFEWNDAKGVKKEKWQTPFRYFFRYELEHLVERSDFKKYQILGDYEGNKLKSDSKEFIIVCEK